MKSKSIDIKKICLFFILPLVSVSFIQILLIIYIKKTVTIVHLADSLINLTFIPYAIAAAILTIVGSRIINKYTKENEKLIGKLNIKAILVFLISIIVFIIIVFGLESLYIKIQTFANSAFILITCLLASGLFGGPIKYVKK